MTQKPSDRIEDIRMTNEWPGIFIPVAIAHFLDEYAASVKSAIIESANKARFPVTCSYNQEDRDAIDADIFIKSLEELL